jgi:hypothetical protein
VTGLGNPFVWFVDTLPVQASKTITDRAISPVFISAKASLTSSRRIRR